LDNGRYFFCDGLFFIMTQENKDYIKHLIKCQCFLPQFESMARPPAHKFIVFSELDHQGLVVPSYAQCPNCGIIHKILEIGYSQIMKKEQLSIIPTIPEIKSQLPDKLVDLISSYNLDLSCWQEIQWIYNNEVWGRGVILSREEIDGVQTGKHIQFFGETNWRINSFTLEEGVASYE
jgi:hypothetical protein